MTSDKALTYTYYPGGKEVEASTPGTRETCSSVSPQPGFKCCLEVGHEGDHRAYTSKTKMVAEWTAGGRWG